MRYQSPKDLRVTELEVGGERLLVLSYPRRKRALLADGVLTRTEAAVANLAIAGLSNGEIAARRGTSIRTVANQMASVLHKLRCGSRRELVVRYVRDELDAHAPSDQSSAS